jgi:hypothetical protein
MFALPHQSGGGAQKLLFEKQESFGYALKADIKHYFDTVDHSVLLNIIERKIRDEKTLWLIKTILDNHKVDISGKGMPIGNLTSQFFANVYLNELDHFVKHVLKAKYYIRYVDDFTIFHRDKTVLKIWKEEVEGFLNRELKVELHPQKTRIIELKRGITMLGFRIFYHHRLLKKSNARRIWKRINKFEEKRVRGEMTEEDALKSLAGWIAYAEFANTYELRKRIVARFNSIIYQSI